MLEPGVLVDASSEKNLIAVAVRIVDAAIEAGYDIIEEVWNADKPKFLDGTATHEMLQDLEVVTDFGLQYLEELTPDGYELLIEDQIVSCVKSENLIQ